MKSKLVDLIFLEAAVKHRCYSFLSLGAKKTSQVEHVKLFYARAHETEVRAEFQCTSEIIFKMHFLIVLPVQSGCFRVYRTEDLR